MARKPSPVRPVPGREVHDPAGRRTVVLLSELAVEGVARPIPAGTIVEGAADRFAGLHASHYRDATQRDRGVAAGRVVQLDLVSEPEAPLPSAPPEPPPTETL